MSLPAEQRRFTIREYLELEEKAVERHEFHDGEILAMSGGTHAHLHVSSNFLISLGLQLRAKGNRCYPLDSNARVRISARNDYVYPDITVVCPPPQFDADDPKRMTIINPRVIIEVLSESTELYDRGAKFDLYRQIPSLQEYVLVSQFQPVVETFVRQNKQSWLFTQYKGMDAVAELRSLDIAVPLSEIYLEVELGSRKVAD
jgi:Uma2 family endonuclease